MPKLYVINARDLIRFIESIGFVLSRVKGSHHRFRHIDGRVTTIPVHGNTPLPKGLLRKIIREDLELTLEEFNVLFSQFN